MRADPCMETGDGAWTVRSLNKWKCRWVCNSPLCRGAEAAEHVDWSGFRNSILGSARDVCTVLDLTRFFKFDFSFSWFQKP
jgi:hypothetical protein